MDPITKRNVIIGLLVIFGLPLTGGSGYAVGQSKEKGCPEVHRVEVKPDPCECVCVFDVSCGDECGQECPPPPPVTCEPCPATECPTIEIVPAGHFVGPVGGYAGGWVAGVGYSRVSHRGWSFDATVGHRWADDVTYTPHYRTWSQDPFSVPGDDGLVVLAAVKWRL